MLRVIHAEYRFDYRVFLVFNQQQSAEVDFEQIVFNDHRQIFQALRDRVYFASFQVQHDTLCWSNGLDFAPEYLFYCAFSSCEQYQEQYQEQFRAWGYASAALH